MVRRPAAVLAALILCLAAPAFAAETGQVARVVDGDTLKVTIGGRLETVRLIGVDTPETVHPNKPAEFFGKEASAFTRRMAEEKLVRLEADSSVGDRGPYGRPLRYGFLPDGKLQNAEIIAQEVRAPLHPVSVLGDARVRPTGRAGQPSWTTDLGAVPTSAIPRMPRGGGLALCEVIEEEIRSTSWG